MEVALVHDWLNQMGGAEAVLENLVQLFPRAPIYTSIYWRDEMPPAYMGWDIRPLWLNHAPRIYERHQHYFALYPAAWASLNLGRYDLVLSNKSGFCHGVHTRRKNKTALHICYCLAPTRYVWAFDEYARSEGMRTSLRLALKPLVAALRRWDFNAAQQVDHFIAISTEIQQRIKRYYKRDSDIIYPPVDIRRFTPQREHDDYYLIVSRLIPYKRIDLAIEAFNRLGLPLVIAGSGRDAARLERLAKPNVQFLGRVPDVELPDLMARCKAFIFPGREDFGITPVEAEASGRPVIAFGAGGALDSVIDGKTGVLFEAQTVESITATVKRFNTLKFDPAVIRCHAETFSTETFKQKLTEFIAEKYEEHLELVRFNAAHEMKPSPGPLARLLRRNTLSGVKPNGNQ
ncbi:MAG TPA: glycosyltransferase [Anaerolineae bacterium]|nr:glycosyltransferase [Anaerolineae bacterium]